MGSALTEFLEVFDSLPQEKQDEMRKLAAKAANGRMFLPNEGPQTEALFCEADELFYGGSAGGGKSALLIGTAVDDHKRSIVFRREFPQIKGLEDEAAKIIGTRDGYNAQDKVWKLPDGNRLEFGSVPHEKDKEKYQGRAHDLKGFDEITQFTEGQYRYIIGWNRSDDLNQRCRVIATGNPPTTAEGMWIINYWGPWLDPHHPDPAEPGELRWYTTIDGEDAECDGPAPIEVNGRMVTPRSRTFIPASLEDNPDLMETGYAAVLEGLPEPLRTMLREGKFDMAQSDQVRQVIPSEWVKAAQDRWSPDKKGRKQNSIGVDVAMGGSDKTILAPLHVNWFDELKEYPGSDTPDPAVHFSLIATHLRDGAQVNVDMGGGYGSGVISRLKEAEIPCFEFVPSGGSVIRVLNGLYECKNIRAEAWWKFREALNPENGHEVELPPDRELYAELCAAVYEIRGNHMLIESKDDIRDRLGRSTDKADAVIMAWFNTFENAVRIDTRKRRGTVNLGHAKHKKYRRR